MTVYGRSETARQRIPFQGKRSFAALLDDLGRLHQNRVGNLEAERLSGFQVDLQFELGWLFDRQIARFCALEYPVNVERCTALHLWIVHSIAHQSPVTIIPNHANNSGLASSKGRS
jgi:hypothetical protein